MKHSLLWMMAALIISLSHWAVSGCPASGTNHPGGLDTPSMSSPVLVLVTLIGLLLFSGLIFRERWLKERAGRRLAEREAQVMVITAREGEQIYIRDLTNAPWRNAHLDTRVYAPGPATAPSPD